MDTPTLKDLFKKQEVIVVRKEYRSLYRLNWKIFFKNVYYMFKTWLQKKRRVYYEQAIVSNRSPDDIAILKESSIAAALDGQKVFETDKHEYNIRKERK